MVYLYQLDCSRLLDRLDYDLRLQGEARDLASDYNYWDTNLRSEKSHSLTAIAMNRRDVRFSSIH